ncbi:MAG: cyclic nucleotide-binding domain-containing protein [Candidatus Promineifilaceae bacterium]|jgi:CRP-like cAMP-binding protein
MDHNDQNAGSADEFLAQALPKLTAEQVREVSPKLVRQIYEPGQVIINQGDAPDRFYIVIAGRAEVWHEGLSGQHGEIVTRKPGEYFGEVGLLQDRPRSATVRAPADSPVEVLAMDRQDFLDLMDESKATEMNVAQEMIQRLISLAEVQ